MTLDEQLIQFGDLLRKLTVEYEIFFSGNRKLPPTNLKFKVENLIKRLLEEQMNYGQKFRYNQLVAKYSLYRDVWRRNTQEMEEGGKLRAAEEIDRLLKRRAASPVPTEEPAEQMAMMIQDPAGEAQEISRLFEYLVALRRRHGEKDLPLNLKKFERLVAEKTAEVRAAYQCRAAEFVVFHDPRQERVRFQVKAKRGEEPAANQTLTGFVYKM